MKAVGHTAGDAAHEPSSHSTKLSVDEPQVAAVGQSPAFVTHAAELGQRKLSGSTQVGGAAQPDVVFATHTPVSEQGKKPLGQTAWDGQS